MMGLLTANWKYKLGSVSLAGLLWLGVVEETELATSVLAPIQYRNVPKDLEMTSDVSDRVRLDIRGPASKIGPAVLADTKVLLDLGGVKRPGERTFPIDRANVVLPSGVDLDRSSPSQVRLRFEPRLTKLVKVAVRIKPRTEQGFEISSQRAEPGELEITGPLSRVKQIDRVETDLIDIDHLKNASEVFTVHAYLADPQVRFAGNGKVSVRVEVRRAAGSPH